VARSACHRGASSRRPALMLHAGLDLSRRRLDVCLLSDHGELIAQTAAGREQLKPLRRGRHPSRRAGLAVLANCHLTEVSMHIQPDRPAHPAPPRYRTNDRETGGQNDTYGFALTAHPGKSQGRPVTPTGSQPIGTARPARPAFSQSPCPGTPATLETGPGDSTATAPSPFSYRYTTLRDVTERRRSQSAAARVLAVEVALGA
jgi:hypothetical protein